PAPIAEIVRFSYGDATGRIFLIAAGATVVALIAAALLPNRPLRRTIDIESDAETEAAAERTGDVGLPGGDAGLAQPRVPDDLAELDEEATLRAGSART
ncbi:hypothetical protein ACWDU1_10400, partial [Nocardia sp. NPDC003345]